MDRPDGLCSRPLSVFHPANATSDGWETPQIPQSHSPATNSCAALGLQVHVTELDVKCPSGCDLAQQADVYRQLLRVCLAQPACTNFETWGFTDKYTLRGSLAYTRGSAEPAAAV